MADFSHKGCWELESWEAPVDLHILLQQLRTWQRWHPSHKSDGPPPYPQCFSALPTFSLPVGCLGTSVPTSWAPGLPSSFCGGALLIKAHSQLPTHTSQVSWKECGGSWVWITRQKHPGHVVRSGSAFRKGEAEAGWEGGRMALRGDQFSDSAFSSVGCSVHCPEKTNSSNRFIFLGRR